MNALIERLRDGCALHPKRWSGDTHDDLGGSVDEDSTDALMAEAAEVLATLFAERDALLARVEAAEAATSDRNRALLWLAGGDSGLSSKAICHHMLGMKSRGDFPWDPGDLGRCLRLLELFPEWKPRMGEMARYSPIWAALAPRWNDLAEMMADEVGIDWSKGKRATRTYDAMQAAIDAARQGA